MYIDNNKEILNFKFVMCVPTHTSQAGAYEGFCLGGGTICARKRAKKIFGVPSLGNSMPPT